MRRSWPTFHEMWASLGCSDVNALGEYGMLREMAGECQTVALIVHDTFDRFIPF